MESKEKSRMTAEDPYLFGTDDASGTMISFAFESAEAERLDQEIGEHLASVL